MKMTVQQLIEELQKIEDKQKLVYFDDEEWGSRPVDEVTLDFYEHDEPVLLKSHH